MFRYVKGVFCLLSVAFLSLHNVFFGVWCSFMFIVLYIICVVVYTSVCLRVVCLIIVFLFCVIHAAVMYDFVLFRCFIVVFL